MIDILSQSQLRTLMSNQSGPCVSIFMPTHRSGLETLQGPIRLKNLLRQVERELMDTGLKAAQTKKVLKPARTLVNHHFFWRHQDDGLALFLSEGMFSYFRLPVPFQELAVVADRFHLKPLLSFVAGDGRFYVLALSQNRVCLYQANRHTMSEVALEGVPASLREALKAKTVQFQLQYHTAAAANSGNNTAIFHGHGAGAEDQKVRLLQFFRQVDRGLRELFQNEQAPLVVAAVDYLFPIYREANSYPCLADEMVFGNPEETSIQDLHSKAWAIVKPGFSSEEEKSRRQYEELAATERTSNDLPTVLRAAHQGRVDLLFVPVGVQRWGKWDADTESVEIQEKATADNEDLLNLAALFAYVNGGKVLAVAPDRMPNLELIAAVFRY